MAAVVLVPIVVVIGKIIDVIGTVVVVIVTVIVGIWSTLSLRIATRRKGSVVVLVTVVVEIALVAITVVLVGVVVVVVTVVLVVGGVATRPAPHAQQAVTAVWPCHLNVLKSPQLSAQP